MKILKIKCRCGYEEGFCYNGNLACGRCNLQCGQACDPESIIDKPPYGLIRAYCECQGERVLQLIYCTHDQNDTRYTICTQCKTMNHVNKSPLLVGTNYYEYKYVLTTGLDLEFMEYICL